MIIDLRGVEFPGDEEEHSTHGGEPLVPLGLALGGLKEPIQRFDKPVGLAGLRPGDDTVEMAFDHPGDVLHGLEL